jgi:hypothetical protein
MMWISPWPSADPYVKKPGASACLMAEASSSPLSCVFDSD